MKGNFIIHLNCFPIVVFVIICKWGSIYKVPVERSLRRKQGYNKHTINDNNLLIYVD